jgi:SH3-like domain-containing protein
VARVLRLATVLLAALAALPAYAEFRSIGEATAILYDAPSPRAKRLFVASRFLPVEIISADGAWARVRDPSGDLAWVERKMLSERRTVLVVVSVAEVRQRPDEQSPIAFRVGQGVALEYAEQSGVMPGWVRVRHRDGATGFVRIREVWGA